MRVPKEKENTKMNPLILAITDQQAAAGAIAAYATVLFVAGALLLILGIMLLIAPLRIWAWTKRIYTEVYECRDIIRNAATDAKKAEKDKKAYLAAILKHIESVESALYNSGEEQPQEG